MAKPNPANSNNSSIELDASDHKIIEALRNNARASIRDIAKATKIRPSTIHLRIQKLIKNSIIEKFTLRLNDKAIGENFIVFMFINTSKDLSKSFFADPRLKEAFGVTGEYDLLLKYKFKDISEFNDYVINLRKNNDIIKTLTTVCTIKLKEEN
ncbi:Lrp/AsnC family transcriptional regulator [Candidatus Woesearchaeota archaeon]|nr:Lrp/AsnC family transcriptional regulator [Candidatus Woesearchaeota archaeon]